MKKSMQKLYFDILSENQKKAFLDLKVFSKYGVLAGGTALALQLGHRKSYDFDIFCPKPITKKLLFEVKKYFKKIQILVDSRDELSFISPVGIKISFVFYPFKNLYKPIITENTKIVFWKDIALDKAHTIGRRGQWRDYVDLYFIVQFGFPLKGIVRGAKKKFGDLFSEKLFLSQLSYFGDIKEFSVDVLTEEIKPQKLQKFFEEKIRQFPL